MSTASTPHSSSHPPPRQRNADVSSVRWQRNAPAAIRAHAALDSYDYSDIVTATVSTTAGRTPEEWVHIAFRGVPSGLLRIVPLIQRVALGLRLELRPSPDRILGWKIAERGENWMRLEAASWFLTGNVLCCVDDGQLSLATFIRYDRPLAAVAWPPISLIHRQVALALMRSAARA